MSMRVNLKESIKSSNMKLPSTREEYTMWALEHSSIDIFSIRYVLEQRGHCIQIKNVERDLYNSVNNEIQSWLKFTIENFPDLVHVRKRGVVLFASVCGIHIRSFNEFTSQGAFAFESVRNHFQRYRNETT